MITAAQLEAVGAQLQALAARVDATGVAFAASRGDAERGVAGLAEAWTGPAPTLLDGIARQYLGAIDAGPLLGVGAVVSSWATHALQVAGELETIERRRASAIAERSHALWTVRTSLAAADADAGAATAAAAEDRARAATATAIAADSAIVALQMQWTRTCSVFAGDVRSHVAQLRRQAGASAISGFAATNGRGFAGWQATLGTAALAALLTSPGVAEAWWASLSQEDRIRFAATTDSIPPALEATITAWKADLSSEETRELYTAMALDAAGIDLETWIPGDGFEANQENVFAVYDYYSSLYLDHPDTLWWAGMASMIGPSFVAGMADLSDVGSYSDLLARFSAVAGHVPGSLLPPGVAELTGMSAAELGNELEYYEDMLLAMQQEIFFDMAVAHEAYLDGGMDAITRLYEDDPYGAGDAAVQAWSLIDEGGRTGDADLVAEGNGMLLQREQLQVINDDYDAMRARPVSGPIVTYLMTATGEPSIPGAGSFAEVYPVELVASASSDGGPLGPLIDIFSPVEASIDVGTATPLPAGNVSHSEDRWRLIEHDTLPAYQELVTEDPERVAEILSQPVAERYGDYRLVNRIDDLATNWEPIIDVDVHADGSVWGVIGDALGGLFSGGDVPDIDPGDIPNATTPLVEPPADDLPPPPQPPVTVPEEQGPPNAIPPRPDE